MVLWRVRPNRQLVTPSLEVARGGAHAPRAKNTLFQARVTPLFSQTSLRPGRHSQLFFFQHSSRCNVACQILRLQHEHQTELAAMLDAFRDAGLQAELKAAADQHMKGLQSLLDQVSGGSLKCGLNETDQALSLLKQIGLYS